MKKNSVTEFELEKQDFKIRLKRGGNGVPGTASEDQQILTYIQPSLAGAVPGAPGPIAAPVSTELDIKSP